MRIIHVNPLSVCKSSVQAFQTGASPISWRRTQAIGGKGFQAGLWERKWDKVQITGAIHSRQYLGEGIFS
jgi:hypothetical protein